MLYFCVIVLIAVILIQWGMIRNDHVLIKDLNDRLMARNYTEYVTTGSRAREDPLPQDKSRPPLSWYDDPMILEGEDK